MATLTHEKDSSHGHAHCMIELVSHGLQDYRLGKIKAQTYLKDTLFPLAPVSAETKERMVKLAATTLLMQRLNCELVQVPQTTEKEHQFILVGAVIDAYDGAIDDKNLDRSVKFCGDLFAFFRPNYTYPVYDSLASPSENSFYAYLPELEKTVPQSEYPSFWKAMKAMHMIQTISLMQRTDAQKRLNVQLSRDELFEISDRKGGLNAITFASLVDPNFADTIPEIDIPHSLSVQDIKSLKVAYAPQDKLFLPGGNLLAQAIYTAGGFVQHLDDLEDMPQDKIDGIQTVFTVDPHMSFHFLRDIPYHLRNIRDQFTQAGKSKQEINTVLSYLDLYLARKILKRIFKKHHS